MRVTFIFKKRMLVRIESILCNFLKVFLGAS